MDIIAVVKIIHVFLLATIKYFITLPYAMLIGLNATQAIISVTVGGITGFFFFYYLSAIIIGFLRGHKAETFRFAQRYLKVDLNALFRKLRPKMPTSTKKKRLFVKFRNKYGFVGIIIATPVLLSIPVGAFLLNRYYSRRKHVFAYMVLSILGWAILFSAIVIILPKPI